VERPKAKKESNMSRRMWVGGLACVFGLALLTATASGQDKKPDQPPKKPEAPKKADEPKKAEAGKPGEKPEAGTPGGAMEEMMKKMMEYGTPGEAHKRMEPLVGKWEFEMRWWMSPGAEPQTSKGTCETKWIMGGRYLQQSVTGPGAAPEAPPFHGQGMLGYDNMKKQYFYTWIDDMSTGMMVGIGSVDATGKVITCAGECPDPMTGQLAKKWRGVVKIESNDKNTYEMYSTGPDGKESKDMEMVYTRVK
jgi:hypothetical protein